MPIFLMRKKIELECEYPHIGAEILLKIKASGITQRHIAEQLGMSRQNLKCKFNKVSIDTILLARLSKVLGFNFFTEYYNSVETEIGKRGNVSEDKSQDTLKEILAELKKITAL